MKPRKLLNYITSSLAIGLFLGIFSASISSGDFFDFLYLTAPSQTTQKLYEDFSKENTITLSDTYIDNFIYFSEDEVYSDVLPSSIKVIQTGELGTDRVSISYLTDKKTLKRTGIKREMVVSSKNQTTIIGNQSFQEFEKEYEKKLLSLLESFVLKESGNAQDSFLDYNQEVSFLENRTIEDIAFLDLTTTPYSVIATNEWVPIHKVIIDLGKCDNQISIPIEYSTENETIKFSNYSNLVNSLCARSGILGFEFGESCLDCTYYPVDRYNQLPNTNYDPGDIVYVSEIPGGQYISNRVHSDLIELFNAAYSAGYYMSLTSGYRSYTVQQNTFESWVQYEIATYGYDRATAEQRAGSYSARAGYSEHQLGTTIDIGAQSCAAFAAECNGTLWDWLAVNSYKYGFVLSYPPNSQEKTGYVHEPWHYRWIGKDLAAEFNTVKDQYVPSEWLKLKNNGSI